MAFNPADIIPYKRSRFQTRLPKGRLYTPSHCWLLEIEPGIWRVGFTRFATRMLGEVVESGFEVKVDEAVKVGQSIGWVEGFKAISDVYCVGDGNFVGANPDISNDPTLIDKDPYHKGWLYQFRGTGDPNAAPPDGYIQVLDAAIDKMMGSEGKSE
ncbi:MAG TPA: glycine cleavage system protein H [Tepidisphaeraceae bacterium]|jgi:glycine cleavage system H protein|nr:glycine cleavage system protein H [Tepidisphaeraceae bacterium]